MQQTYKCPHCGMPVEFGARFCGNCGTQLSWPVMQQPHLSPSHQEQPQKEFQESNHQKPRHDGNSVEAKLMKCAYHPEIDAVACCSKCQKSICGQCRIIKMGSGKVYCKHCVKWKPSRPLKIAFWVTFGITLAYYIPKIPEFTSQGGHITLLGLMGATAFIPLGLIIWGIISSIKSIKNKKK